MDEGPLDVHQLVVNDTNHVLHAGVVGRDGHLYLILECNAGVREVTQRSLEVACIQEERVD